MSKLTFDEYDALISPTATYPGKGELLGRLYTTLGLAGEAGEAADKVKKVLRDKNCEFSEEDIHAILLELSDVLWYISRAAHEFGSSTSEVAAMNVEKVRDRKSRGVIHGEGDNR